MDQNLYDNRLVAAHTTIRDFLITGELSEAVRIVVNSLTDVDDNRLLAVMVGLVQNLTVEKEPLRRCASVVNLVAISAELSKRGFDNGYFDVHVVDEGQLDDIRDQLSSKEKTSSNPSSIADFFK